MVKDYRKGIIFKINEEDTKQYIVLSNIKKESNTYLLVMPIEDITNIQIDFEKSFVVKANEVGGLDIEEDREIIKYVLTETIKTEKESNN